MAADTDFIIALNEELNVVIEKYKSTPISEISELYGFNMQSKNILHSLLLSVLKDNLSKETFELINNKSIVLKTVKLDKYGKLKEAMSFPVFKYCELIQETWESSSLRRIFSNSTFAFVVFVDDRIDLFFEKVILWKMPNEILETDVKKVWNSMNDCLSKGKIVKYIDDQGKYHTYFPSSTDNPYVHVRPHALNRKDTLPLPVQDSLTGLISYPKHSFWLNRSYILKIINEESK